MKAGDKVVCIDATPLPMIAPRDCDLSEFSFPDGFIEEGAIYCIDGAIMRDHHVFRIYLVGKRILFRGEEVGWNSLRFRKLSDHKAEAKSKQAKEPVTG